MGSIYEKIVLAQNGNEPAMLGLIEQFSPLLKKYAYLLQTEDALDELTVDFIEFIMTVKLDSLHSCNDGALVNYIKNTVRTKYIAKSKRRQEDARMLLHWADFDESLQRKYEPQQSLFSAEQDFLQWLPKSVLSEMEFKIVALIFLYGYSSAEIARTKNITRQAVNQIKHRALKKIFREMSRNEM